MDSLMNNSGWIDPRDPYYDNWDGQIQAAMAPVTLDNEADFLDFIGDGARVTVAGNEDTIPRAEWTLQQYKLLNAMRQRLYTKSGNGPENQQSYIAWTPFRRAKRVGSSAGVGDQYPAACVNWLAASWVVVPIVSVQSDNKTRSLFPGGPEICTLTRTKAQGGALMTHDGTMGFYSYMTAQPGDTSPISPMTPIFGDEGQGFAEDTWWEWYSEIVVGEQAVDDWLGDTDTCPARVALGEQGWWKTGPAAPGSSDELSLYGVAEYDFDFKDW